MPTLLPKNSLTSVLDEFVGEAGAVNTWCCRSHLAETEDFIRKDINPLLVFFFSCTCKAMATRRTQRKRKVSERMRVVGDAELAAARARRLDALEADADEGAGDGGEADAGDDEYVLSDEDGDGDGGGRGRGRKKKGGRTAKKARRASARSSVRAAAGGARKPKGIERWNKPLAVVLDEEGPGGPAEAPGGYWAIAALPSSRPPRQLCSVCGFRAPYTCTRCAVRFCSIKCGTVHEETRCLKFTL